MGRLFWKFFLSILLAQLVTTLGVGTVFWLRDQSRMQSMAKLAGVIDTSRGAEFVLDAAALTLKHGGRAALEELVAGSTRYSLYVIDDDSGREMLGRRITPELRAQAAALLAQGTRRHAVRMLTAPDGKRYLAFLRWFGGPGPGPGFGQPAPQAGPGARPALPPMGMRGPRGFGGPPYERPLLPTITLIGGLLASFVFAGLLAWYFSRPIRALRGAFEAAAAGDLAPRFQTAGRVRGDELTDLGRDFDRMSAQLRALMDGQRRLLHDVSHELRSPLARLQAAIGLAHQQPERIGASLARIERESVRMDKLVGELLTLSRLEAMPTLPAQEEIPIMELVDDITEDASFEAEQSGRRIAVRGGADATVRAAPDLLWRAIENVVRNAIKHSPADGTVCIDVSADAAMVQVAVLDRGPGVVPGDLEAIFAPFFRSEPAANNVDGHGLGLAIARRVVAAHGGTITARNRDGGGLEVLIVLPLSLPTVR